MTEATDQQPDTGPAAAVHASGPRAGQPVGPVPDDTARRREWAAAYRWLAAERRHLRGVDSEDLDDYAGEIEREELTPWADQPHPVAVPGQWTVLETDSLGEPVEPSGELFDSLAEAREHAAEMDRDYADRGEGGRFRVYRLTEVPTAAAEPSAGGPAATGPHPDTLAGVETLHANEWLSLRIVRKPEVGVNGYVYSHESRCQGRIVAVLPYRVTGGGRVEYLVKSEMTPCWGFDQVLSAITGGYEGGDIEDDAVREMLEETGYTITRDELIPLGESFASKSADTVYSLFSVNLTDRVQGGAIGDGSRVEAESTAVWLASPELAEIRDPQVAVMQLRLSPRFGQHPDTPEPGGGSAAILGRALLHLLSDYIDRYATARRDDAADALAREAAQLARGETWADPMGQWTADQAEAAGAQKQLMVDRLLDAANRLRRPVPGSPEPAGGDDDG